MTANDHPDNAANRDSNNRPLSSAKEFTIDHELIERWKRIPRDETLNIELPRAAFDLLYASIERAYFAMAQALDVFGANDANRVARAEEFGVRIIDGVNSLRQYQTLIMSISTSSEIDAEGRVVLEGESDAE